MGGYAGFVWPAYAVTVIVLGLVFVFTWRLLKTSEKRLEALQAARGRRPRRQRAETAAGVAANRTTPPSDSAPAGAAGESR